jgi:hypothetical protein
MRKSMKLGAASTLAAVALLAGSASAASAFGGEFDGKHEGDPYVCGNSSTDSGAGDGGNSTAVGYGPVTACQVGETNIFNNNQNGEVSGGDIFIFEEIIDIVDTVA